MGYANRASAIFPVYVSSQSDTIIVFLDYWRLKNKDNSVFCMLRVYDNEGRVATRTEHKISSAHNEISMALLLNTLHFEGMVEIEFLSNRNLIFSYPAIVAFFRSGKHFSVVHSSGRVRNTDEVKPFTRSLETNWTCKLDNGFVPFFHVFNGPRDGSTQEFVVRLLDKSGTTIGVHKSNLGLANPFSSRLVKLSELFDLTKQTEGSFFVSIDIADDDCFPRLVVGNFNRELDFIEATHTFFWSKVEDMLTSQSSSDHSLLSFIPAPKIPELDLEMVFYPTNAPSEVAARVRSTNSPARPLANTGQLMKWRTGGEGSEVWRYKLPDDVALMSLDLVSDRVPARINVSYRYSVRNSGGMFSTDIATGAHAHVYPPKYSHWGHGLISHEFETVLLIRNIAHQCSTVKLAVGSLRVFESSGVEVLHSISVCSESFSHVRLKDILANHCSGDVRFVSWLLQSDCPDLEVYWISWAPNGSICGEHAF